MPLNGGPLIDNGAGSHGVTHMPDQTDASQIATIVLVLIAAVAILPLFAMGVGMVGYGPMMGGMWGDGTMPTWLIVVGVLVRLLMLVALVGGGYLIYRAVAGSEDDSDRALEELRRAYARGDLTDDEYEHRRERLERDT